MFKKYKVRAKLDRDWGVSYYITKRFLLFFYVTAYHTESWEGGRYTTYRTRDAAESICRKLRSS